MLHKHNAKQPLPINILISGLLALLSVLLVGGAYTGVALTRHQTTRNAANATTTMPMSGSSMPTSINMGSAPVGTGIPVTSLQAPQTAAHVDHFTLTTQPARLTLAPSTIVDALTYTLDGKVFPDTPTITVKTGQLVHFHLVNESPLVHPMHLHGHSFVVLTRDGRPVTGSPVYLDTINIQPHESYDIAFYANNPGIWMFHCHNLYHANWGMDMMVVYQNISTPYSIGTVSGNLPD